MRRWLPLFAVALLGAACSEPVLAPSHSTSSNADVFDAIWTEFDLHYSYFIVKNVDWNAARDRYRPQAVAAANDVELARVIGNMLAELRDRHVSLTPTGAGSTISYRAPSDTAVAAFDASLVGRRYLAPARTSAGGHVQYGMVSPSVGYVRLSSFGGSGWGGELDAAIRDMPTATSMIVDVRGNPGGSHDLAMAAAGRFATASYTYSYTRIRNGPRHDDFTAMTAQKVEPAGPTQFRGPVVVLTNRQVYSSAEDFVLAMEALPSATTMGDTTAGASGRPMTRELQNGWTYTVSTWIEYTADQKVFENIGLAPDVYVAAQMTDIAAGNDPVLDRAIQVLGSR
ncbi:MAG TPA: S41 family peptidase [Gemmatimonadaceae bacterium]